MRNALAYAGKTQRRIVSAWIGTAFAQYDAAAARKQWREVVGIFANEAAVTRLIGALLLEQNDEWAVQRSRYMTWKLSRRSAMILPSACQPWEPDRQLTPAHRRRSYTTRRGTIC